MGNTLLTITGFGLFLIGFIALVLSLVGLNLALLNFTNSWPGVWSFALKLTLMFGGIALFYINRTKDTGKKNG